MIDGYEVWKEAMPIWVFLGSVLVAVGLLRGVARVGCLACKKLTRKRQDRPALVTWEDEA